MNQTRANYAGTFGPTTGDRVRLGDTELFIEVERDLVTEGGGYGNEVKFGGGKVIRDGMGQSSTASDAESLDLVVTNALILDPVLGVIKADIGVKAGRIVGIGSITQTTGQSIGYFLARFNSDGTLDDGSASDSTPGDNFGNTDTDGVDGVFVNRSAAAFDNADHVDIVIHNYRWRLALCPNPHVILARWRQR